MKLGNFRVVKKFFICLGLIGLCSRASSQIVSGKIVYSIDMERFAQSNDEDGVASASDALVLQTAELAKDMQVELLFNNKIAVFRNQKSMTSDAEYAEFEDLVKTLICGGEYYTDLDHKTQIFATELDGKVKNVQSAFKTHSWVLSRETKKIGDFTCYKAMLQKGMMGDKHEIVAWYTPEIPIPLGPKEYVGNLPGLILELDDPLVRYRCSSIEINKPQQVKWPTDIEVISEEQYKKESEALWGRISNNH